MGDQWGHELGEMIASIVDRAVGGAYSLGTVFPAGVCVGGARGRADERIDRLRDRFVDELRPRYEDGYDAGVASAEVLSFAELSTLVRRRWRVQAADVPPAMAQVLEARWGSEWRDRLEHGLERRGLSDALRDVWAAVMRRPFEASPAQPPDEAPPARPAPDQPA